MADNARAKRLADLIREVVAQKLQRGIKDPRLGSHVTITDTRVTGDLREATVFYTVYGDDEDRAAAAAGLESAKGVLRSEVGKAAGVKFTPTLAFVADALPDNARTIEDLLDKARAADARVREVSAGARYAGESDPYRKPSDDEEEGGAEAAGDGTAASHARPRGDAPE
ncbi:30S ribosome-binding factor RbfA [Streptomyces sp. TS71-3]|uniref:30S ribosome-binding factor RbfA n=1 Tax=Streptomyces sp. TS71-3 TaxID=2733862 RepID=UPI001B228721|nr:30S ribosome-binding factor RbfA [Streptomyces sp. TS71-3]GHJ36371.1 ribosome-binding factor A [Streptomyces sp. TS71-3]